MKRILYLFGIIVVVALVVGIGYFFRYRTEPLIEEQTAAPAGGGLPAAQAPQKPAEIPQGGGAVALSQKFGVVTSNPVHDYFVDSQNNPFFVQPDGQVIKIVSNKAGALSSTPIQNLISASFSYDGQKLLAVFGDPGSPQTSVFDVPGKSWRPLPADIRNPAWAPADYRIAYLSSSGGFATLNLGDSKAKPQTLARLRGEDLALSWPAANTILLQDKPATDYRGSLWRFDIKRRVFTLIMEDQLGLVSAWNPNADRGVLFASSRASRGGILKLVDGSGNALNVFGFLTLPSKCAFYEESVVPAQATTTATSTKKAPTPPKPVVVESLLCAVPRNQPELVTSPLPDAYEKRALFTEDTILKINLSTGNISLILDGAPYSLDAERLRVFGKKLFFVNRYDKKLYAVSLD